ncbi:MAG: serine hydrolase domain-containing protein, partial [Bacteroidota bacterium]
LKQLIHLIIIVGLTFSCKPQKERIISENSSNSILNLRDEPILIDSIDSFLVYKMKEMQIPGISLVIINDGEVVYHLTKGFADKEQNKQVTNTTLFEGASTSKSLFAYLVMFLVEEKKLDLDVPLYQYLASDLRENYNYDKRYEQITARMVLSHTTGFPNWRGKSELTINFEPGTNFSYSGEGYQFLVKACESILDTDYLGLESYFQEKVAIPLGLKHTKFVQDNYTIKNKAFPYNNGDKMQQNHWTAEEFNAASAVHTEAQEFSKWLIALMNKEGLSKESHEQLFEDQITVADAPTLLTEEGAIAWTLGFAKYNISDWVVYGHEGNNDGFNALFLMDREKKWAMVQFNNANEVYDFGFELFKYINK